MAQRTWAEVVAGPPPPVTSIEAGGQTYHSDLTTCTLDTSDALDFIVFARNYNFIAINRRLFGPDMNNWWPN